MTRCFITGGSGFLGRRVVAAFRSGGYDVVAPPSSECDLLSFQDTAASLLMTKADIVVHTAAQCGGIAFNAGRQARQLHDNAVMTLNVLEAARRANVSTVLLVGSSCAYPDLGRPAREEDLWAGLPHSSVYGYGIAKRLAALQSLLYTSEHGMRVTTIMFPNLYGPWAPSDDATGHFVASLARRIVEAQRSEEPAVTVWGSGTPVRELLFVDDAAQALVRAATAVCPPWLNVGTGQGHTIRKVAHALRCAAGYQGQLVFDRSRSDGQSYKVMNVSRMKHVLGWTPPTSFAEGIRKTVDGYRQT